MRRDNDVDSTSETPPLRRILQIDDDEDILLVARMSLEGYGGLDVRTALTAREGLIAVRLFRPQLVIVDYRMPEMDGLTFLRELRRTPGGERLPVVFLTASVNEAVTQELLAAGACAVLSKPFDARRWVDQLREIWRRA